MEAKQERVSFKPTPRVKAWITGIKEKLEQMGDEFNQSKCVIDQLEYSLETTPELNIKLAENQENEQATLMRLSEKLSQERGFLDKDDVYYLLFQAHQVYRRYNCSYVRKESIYAVVDCFKQIVLAAKEEGWVPREGDEYFLGNLRGDANPDLSLFDRIVAKTDATLEIIYNEDYYSTGGAELHARNAEVALKWIPISVDALNFAISKHKNTLFELAAFSYGLKKGKEVTFKQQSTRFNTDFEEFEFEKDGIKLSIIIENHRILGCTEWIDKEVKLGMCWRTILEWHRAFRLGAPKTSEVELIRRRGDSVLFCHDKSGLRMEISQKEHDAIGELLNDFITRPENQKAIEMCSELYGRI